MIKLKAMITSMALTLSMSLCQMDAFAYPAKPGIRLRVLLTNTVPMPTEVIVNMLTETLRQIKTETKIKISLKSLNLVNDINPQRTIDYEKRVQELRAWEKLTKKRDTMILIITNALTSDGNEYLGGIASGVCKPKGIAIANIKYFRATGESAIPADVVIAKHELGHLLGAMHSREGVMRKDALGLTNGEEPIPYSSQSKKQTRRCQNATM